MERPKWGRFRGVRRSPRAIFSVAGVRDRLKTSLSLEPQAPLPYTMSSTTILELPEAQMLDYTSDGDYTMHATGQSTEWLSVEATMSDDHIPSGYSETIEIDMDRNDEDEITEYEMTDGVDVYDQGEEEIVDVDFTESSRVASPMGVHSALELEAPSPQLSFPTPQSSIPPQSLLSPSAQPEGLAFPHYVSVLPTDVVEHTPAPSADTVPGPELSAVPTSPDLLQGPFTPSSALPESEDPAQPTDERRLEAQPGSPVEQSATTTLQQDSEPLTSSLSVDGRLEERGSAAHVPQAEPSLAGDEAAAGLLAVGQPGDDTTADTAPTIGSENISKPESNVDPHEISDGVYIDPPPPVLLSLSFSGQRLECCLFNQPQSRSGSQSPNAHASTSAAPDVALLLSQKPTLYYEPLNNVFEALHQEELIGNLEEFADGELVLEAYDLDLRISEVSVFVSCLQASLTHIIRITYILARLLFMN